MNPVAGRIEIVKELALFFERRSRRRKQAELEHNIGTNAVAELRPDVRIGPANVLHLKIAARIVAAKGEYAG